MVYGPNPENYVKKNSYNEVEVTNQNNNHVFSKTFSLLRMPEIVL